MSRCRIKVYSKENRVKSISSWSEFAILVYSEEYQKGDYILIESEDADKFLTVCLDDSLPATIVYLAKKTFRMGIPFDDEKKAYSPKSFSGNLHMLSAKTTEDDQIFQRRNLAFNPYDTVASEFCYPHASTNVVTRGEAVFAARNTIDGVYANSFHGDYPFQSWGITLDPSAALKIDLGTSCTIDQIRLTLRADFPHDNYWVKAALEFSEGSKEVLNLAKTELPQIFNITPKNAEWAVLKDLIISDEPSPFPALTQIELWGTVNRL